ncbi:MAG: hypothetical protein ACPGVO_23470, partial [Spirulinaceae cyanobacterium]
ALHSKDYTDFCLMDSWKGGGLILIFSQKAISKHTNRISDNPRTIPEPRRGWEQAFISMGEHQDDVLLDNDLLTEWEPTEWEW